jgi:hypothetical protein
VTRLQEATPLEVTPQVSVVVSDPAVATEVRERRMLSPDEIAELVEMYWRGATQPPRSR